MEEIIFMECGDCAKKPGTPELCPQCLAVRGLVTTVNTLIRKNNDLKDEVETLNKDLTEMRRNLVKAITTKKKR